MDVTRARWHLIVNNIAKGRPAERAEGEPGVEGIAIKKDK
jgi:hypothetical protein